MFPSRLSRIVLVLAPLAIAAGCATQTPMSSMSSASPMSPAVMPQSQRPETVYAVTVANTLVSFNAGAPGKLVSSARLTGFAPGETVAGIDFRPANGKLYAITNAGRLYDRYHHRCRDPNRHADAGAVMKTRRSASASIRPSTASGTSVRAASTCNSAARARSSTPTRTRTACRRRRARVRSATCTRPGSPATGAAYTNNFAGAKSTTNFVIDANLGVLATQVRAKARRTRYRRTPDSSSRWDRSA